MERWTRTGALAAVLVLMTLAIGPVAMAAPPAGAEPADCAGHGIPQAKIGVQQFTYLPTLFGGGDVTDIVEHMSAVGIRNVERFGGTFGLTLEEYDQLFDDNHVRPVASHGSLARAGFEQVLADAKHLDQKYVGSGGFGGPGFGSLDSTLETAENLDTLGRMAHRQGLRLFAHNHDDEFFITYDYDLDGDGDTEPTSVVEIVLAETDPRYVSLELDVHWARDGIAERDGHDVNDPVNQQAVIDFIDRYADRIPLMHVKDTSQSGAIATVGEGTTDWAAIFRAATDVKHYFIEYDFPPSDTGTVEAAWAYLTCLSH